eukprot:3419496-Pyramimonas_sp.AAC.1
MRKTWPFCPSRAAQRVLVHCSGPSLLGAMAVVGALVGGRDYTEYASVKDKYGHDKSLQEL